MADSPSQAWRWERQGEEAGKQAKASTRDRDKVRNDQQKNHPEEESDREKLKIFSYAPWSRARARRVL